MNIDLKGFTEKFYEKIAGGNLNMVKEFITEAVKRCHVEITTLIIPGENDHISEIREISSWIASLENERGERIGESIPLHVSRFFPRFKMTDRPATDTELIYKLADAAREKLKYVYTGNC